MRHLAGFLTVACALGARALLFPAGISTVNAVVSSLSTPDTTKSSTIQLACSTCNFQPEGENRHPAEKDSDALWIQEQTHSLVLEFSVTEDGERLMMNNETIYPMRLSDAGRVPQLHATQVPWSSLQGTYGSQEDQAVLLEITGSVVTINERTPVSEDGDVIIPLTFGIVELEHLPVAVDSVSVTVLKTAGGELFIKGLESTPNLRHRPSFQSPAPLLKDFPELDHLLTDAATPESQHAESQKCDKLCRFKAMVGSRIASLRQGGSRNCGHAKLGYQKLQLPAHIRPHFLRPAPEDENVRHSERPEHHRPHGSHYHHGHRHHGHHHGRHSHFFSAFTRGAAAILIPTLAGVIVGMAVSVLGLGLGRLITFLWIKLVRGGRRDHASVSQEDGDVEKEYSDDSNDEPLPVYEEAPAYEDAIIKPR